MRRETKKHAQVSQLSSKRQEDLHNGASRSRFVPNHHSNKPLRMSQPSYLLRTGSSRAISVRPRRISIDSVVASADIVGAAATMARTSIGAVAQSNRGQCSQQQDHKLHFRNTPIPQRFTCLKELPIIIERNRARSGLFSGG